MKLLASVAVLMVVFSTTAHAVMFQGIDFTDFTVIDIAVGALTPSSTTVLLNQSGDLTVGYSGNPLFPVTVSVIPPTGNPTTTTFNSGSSPLFIQSAFRCKSLGDITFDQRDAAH